MDWTIVDLTDVTDASVDDEVILIGSGGEASITAEDLAARLGTISYEITCGISSRVTRRFVETGQPAPKSSENLQGFVS